ncbi:hypothetical protein [Psychrobacter immobilis]|uniref:hypothetical protein n=1 Tax=Psychrobacter immobilis TaxID=498 RepID=UPI001918F049|nr:hypothetical protein [Psychrobacter immobilis]
MDKFRDNLIATLGSTISAIKSASYACQTAFMLGLVVLPIMVHADSAQSHYKTYVIDTYGGEALLPAVRQQLNTSRDGGTVGTYQGKLILQTTAANYQTVQQLLAQIDRQPQALIVTVQVGNNSSSQSNIQQGQIIINNRGIKGSGIINQSNSQQQSNSSYQVQTLSGSAASISTGTLYSLTQTYNGTNYPNYNRTNYPNYNRPSGQIIIQQQVLLPTTQGISVTPRLLANGQIEVQLSQVEERLVRSNSSYNENSFGNNSIQGQRLSSTLIVPRGQWTTIGQISQDSASSGNRAVNSNRYVPISLLIQ